jgi:lipopolysaccharide cholinephosphotransferase
LTKFREVCKSELNTAKYFFQDHTTDPHYRWGYGRIRRTNSEFVRAGQEHLKMRTGMFLDIFPSDNIPDFYPARVINCFVCFILRKVLYSEVGRINEQSAVKRFVYKLMNMVPAHFAFRRFESMQRRFNMKKTKFNRTLAFPPRAGSWLGTPRKWDEDVTEISFEGHAFLTSAHYKEYLPWRFGDYMQLPPASKRHWHPATKISFPED